MKVRVKKITDKNRLKKNKELLEKFLKAEG